MCVTEWLFTLCGVRAYRMDLPKPLYLPHLNKKEQPWHLSPFSPFKLCLLLLPLSSLLPICSCLWKGVNMLSYEEDKTRINGNRLGMKTEERKQDLRHLYDLVFIHVVEWDTCGLQITLKPAIKTGPVLQRKQVLAIRNIAGIARTILSFQKLPRKVLTKQAFALSHPPPPDCVSIVISFMLLERIRLYLTSFCGWFHCAVSIEKKAVKGRSDSGA